MLWNPRLHEIHFSREPEYSSAGFYDSHLENLISIYAEIFTLHEGRVAIIRGITRITLWSAYTGDAELNQGAFAAGKHLLI